MKTVEYRVYEVEGRWFVRETVESGYSWDLHTSFRGHYKAMKLAKWLAKRHGAKVVG